MFRDTTAKDNQDLLKQLDTRLDDEFLLIFTKLKVIDVKLDRLLALEAPEALLSQSEMDMMKSWRAQVKDMDETRTNEADNTPTGS